MMSVAFPCLFELVRSLLKGVRLNFGGLCWRSPRIDRRKRMKMGMEDIQPYGSVYVLVF